MVDDLCADNHRWGAPINESNLMYRTQYLVLNRTILEAMPKEWQHRLVALIEEIGDEFNYYHPDWPGTRYLVKHRGARGRFSEDPFGPYHHPTGFIEKFRKIKPPQK